MLKIAILYIPTYILGMHIQCLQVWFCFALDHCGGQSQSIWFKNLFDK